MRLVEAVAVVGFLAGCGEERARTSTGERATLGGDAVVKVGAEVVPKALVAEVARAERTTSAEAARRLADDAVAASAARERGLDRQAPASWRLRAARARIASDRLLEEARRAGPPTDEEVRELSEVHWAQVDRPPTVTAVHALVKLPPPDKREAARTFAGRMREDLLQAKDEADFQARAKAAGVRAKAEGLEVITESIPPFEAGGALVEGGALVPAFAAAAHALAAPGDTSPLVETPFGVHVIRLLQRFPEQRMPFESRRVAFTEEAITRRARVAYEALLERARKGAPVEVLPSAETTMRELHGAERRP